MTRVDTILRARWIVPVDDASTVLNDHAIVIDEDRILDILPDDDIDERFETDNDVDLTDHLLIPGLINTHTHASMSLFRGLADDLPLMTWLHDHIWPAESEHVNEDFVQLGTELAIAEMIRSGTTCMNDMYFFPDVTARVCRQHGFRASTGLIVLDFPTVWARDADEYLDKGLALHDQYRDDQLISTAFAPHAPYTVSDAPLEKIRTLADELDLPIHMHVHETAHEVEAAVSDTGRRPLARLDELGLVSPQLLAVHMTQLTAEEITLIADKGSHVLHCPESNLKLASGICPVHSLIDAGVNIALGTDGAASNNDLDMLGEMKTAALLAKGQSGDATAVPAIQALQMATINGARALGMEDRIGTLEAGKQADIVAIDMNTIETSPVYDPVSHLVYCCGREQVTDVWIAGNAVLRDRELQSLDTQRLVSESSKLKNHIIQ